MSINRTVTNRGFDLLTFLDRYGAPCSLQKSSLAEDDAIWFGVDNANPQILHGDAKAHGIETDATCGWVPYPIPDCVSLTTRMHLTHDQVRDLLPYLQHFVDTGELPRESQATPSPPTVSVPVEVAEAALALMEVRIDELQGQQRRDAVDAWQGYINTFANALKEVTGHD